VANEIVLAEIEKALSGASLSVYFIDPIDPVITSATGVLIKPSPSDSIPDAHEALLLFTDPEKAQFDAGTSMFTLTPGIRLTDAEVADPQLAAVKVRAMYAFVDERGRTRPEAMRARYSDVGRRLSV
jgi:hypothetical protein